MEGLGETTLAAVVHRPRLGPALLVLAVGTARSRGSGGSKRTGSGSLNLGGLGLRRLTSPRT